MACKGAARRIEEGSRAVRVLGSACRRFGEAPSCEPGEVRLILRSAPGVLDMLRTTGLRKLVEVLRQTPEAVAKLVRWQADWLTAEPVPVTHARAPKRLAADAKLRVVMVTPYQFFPVQHGGGTLIYHTLRELARRGHDVSVVGFVDSDDWVRAAAPLREFCRDVRLLVRPQRALAEERLRVAPLHTVLFEMPELRRELDAVIEEQDVDVLQIEYTQLASFARPAERSIACVTAHDIAFVSQYRRAVAAEDDADGRRLKELSEYLRTFHHEITALRRCDVVFPVSAHDGRLLRRYLGRGAHVATGNRTGIEVARLATLERRPEAASLLFVGFFLHPPNVDAILWFAREVLPRIHRERPEVTLTVVGANPPEEVRRLADDPRVKVEGFVEDLDACYARSTAMVAPIRMGAGVRIKILDAFAAGVPVLSTKMGAEGLDVESGRELLVATSPEEMAAQALQLMGDPALQARLSGAARAFVQREHAWPAVVERMESEYRRALQRRGLMEAP